MKKMNPVVHFEMPAKDLSRMSNFYTNAFGWKTQQLGEEMGSYVLASTTEVDANARPKQPGAINGGFYPVKEGETAQPSLVIAVDNIKDAIKSINDAGGKVLAEPVEIPGYGWYIMFTDTEGNKVGVMEPFMK